MSDELLQEAKEISENQGYVSVSYLQRRMRIGYVRAAKLVDYMIQEGFCEAEYANDQNYRFLITHKPKNRPEPTPDPGTVYGESERK